jgi:hypothetical protein
VGGGGAASAAGAGCTGAATVGGLAGCGFGPSMLPDSGFSSSGFTLRPDGGTWLNVGVPFSSTVR